MLKVKPFIHSVLISIISLLIIALVAKPIWAQENTHDDVLDDVSDEISNQYGLGLSSGFTYDPTNDIRFLQINAFALYDYEKVWRHAAPEPLRFKIECNLGLSTNDSSRAVCSLNMLALYYLDNLSNQLLRPYVEGGIGVIYTDFQVKNQGLRVNFNPQLGIGTEIFIDSKPAFYAAIRAHHLSNGEIRREENRGVNSVVLVAGRFF